MMTNTHDKVEQPPAWGAVWAMTLCAMAIITSEFLPVSLLTPISADLHISEGNTGQSIAISGLFAVITSLFLTTIIGRHDRKLVALFFTGLMAVSGTIVSMAPNATTLMFGRALLGVCIGGFWGMSASVVMRLVPARSVPKALALLNAGNAFAMMAAAPVGSYLGEVIGWRGTFFIIVPLIVVTFIWQALMLPKMPAIHSANARGLGLKSLAELIKRSEVQFGMIATALLFMGMFSLFTYLRPFYETVIGVGPETLSLLLLTLGSFGMAGTFFIGLLLQKTVYGVLIYFPFCLMLCAISMVVFGHSLTAMFIVIGIWGFLSTSAPVGWWTWLSETLPDDAEAGGGLMVAVIQFSIMGGAAIGGGLYDMTGYSGTFIFSACLLAVATLMAIACSKLPLGE